MKRLKQQWVTLSTEAKLGIVVMPIVLAVLGGFVIPFLVDTLCRVACADERGFDRVDHGLPSS